MGIILKLKYRFYLLVTGLLVVFNIHGQMIGKPFITNYTKSDIGIESQNHDIIQDSRGIIYMANDFGILEFDGQHWSIIQTSTNRSNIISLAIDKNNRIYCGAQGDIGYLDYDNEYKLIFRSLINKIPVNDRQFGDVWQTLITPSGIIFHSWDATFIYQNDTITVVKFNELARGSFIVRDTVYIQGPQGLYRLKDNKTTPVPFSDVFVDREIAFMLPYGANGLLIGTLTNGLFKIINNKVTAFPLQSIQPIGDLKMINGKLLRTGIYVLVTLQNGLVFIDQNGIVQQHITKTDGLQSNRVTAILSDQSGNLWAAGQGVDYIETAPPFRSISLNQDDPIAVYASIIYNKNLYAATHGGLYYTSWQSVLDNKPLFKPINGISDIIWNLQEIEGQLIVSTKDGFYQVEGTNAKLLAKTDGAWLVHPVDNRPELLLGGTYKGLVLLEKKNNQYQLKYKIQGFTESSRVLESDNHGNVWTCHGYKGAFKLKLSPDFSKVEKVSFYDHNKGFPTDVYIGVYKVNDNLVFSSQYGFYTYNQITDSMEINRDFTSRIGESQHSRFIKQFKEKVWFIFGETTGYITLYPDGSSTITTWPFNKLNEHYIPGFENFTFIEPNNALIGTKKDLIYYDGESPQNNQQLFNVLLRSVVLPLSGTIIYSDRYQYLCNVRLNENPTIPYNDNNLIFGFAASFYENIHDIKFSFYLEGFDKKWTDWVSSNQKEYTNLSEGHYVFRVKARNIYNTVSNEVAFQFTVLPPWYRTIWAYIAYTLLFASLIFLIFQIRGKQLQREKQIFITEQKKKQELETARLMEDKLKNELETKNNDLATLASNVIYKNERISEIKLRIEEISGDIPTSVQKKLEKVLEFIDIELEDDKWDNFELRFNQAQNNFLMRFKEAYPELTPKDLKFCAYLRMNLSTKEIAHLLNMSIRGVENARYRIRKRVGIESTDNLTEFILMF